MSDGNASEVSVPGGHVDIRITATPESVWHARHALDGLQLPEWLLLDGYLLVTEMVTNSIRHGGLDPEDTIRVVATWSGHVLKVSVQDRQRPAASKGIAGSIRPSPDAESGWGLYMVDRIAKRWGLDPERGYWFELEVDERA